MLARHLRSNFGFYLVVLLTLGMGIVVGAMKSPLTVEADIASTLLARMTESKPGLTIGACLINQFPWWLTMSLLGLTVIGVLLVLPLIFFKGYCVGYTVYTLSRAHNDTSMGLALTAVLPHNLIYIPCLVVMAAAALRFSVALFSPERNGNTIIKSLLAYVIIMLLAGGGIWLGALVECRVTPWLLHWW